MNEAQIFLEWFTEKEKTVGSLVTPATAAKMIGITPQYLDKIVNAGRLTKHYSPEDNIPFIGMNEIRQEIARREEKRKLKEGKSKTELLEDELQKLQKKCVQYMVKILRKVILWELHMICVKTLMKII